jgi:hypothetical protein
MPETGQECVRQGLLAATIVVPTNTGQAIEMMARTLQAGTTLPEKTFTNATSYPPIEKLANKPGAKSRATGA